jgi:hypothetical protein
LSYLKFYLKNTNIDGNLACDSVALTGRIEEDAKTIADIESTVNFNRWWTEDDRIESLLPPEPYQTWAEYLKGWSI